MTAQRPDTRVPEALAASAHPSHGARAAASHPIVANHGAATPAALIETVSDQLQDVTRNLSEAMELIVVAETALRGQQTDADVPIANMLQRYVGHPIYVEIERLETLLTWLGKGDAKSR